MVVVSLWAFSTWVMMRVPPPCSMRAFAMSWIGAGRLEVVGIGRSELSGVVGLSCPGVCIGRKVMAVVTFRLFRILCAALSIVCDRKLEVVDWKLLICLVERQADIRRVMTARIATWVVFVLNMALKCFKWCFSYLMAYIWYKYNNFF